MDNVIKAQLTKESIKAFVEANPSLVQRKATSNLDLFVLKYTKKVFYDNLWTKELLECRGTIVDKDYNVVSRPFTKVFNYLENGTTIEPDTECLVSRKVNGFMAAVTLYNGQILISTTGSIDSEFVGIARKHLEPFLDKIHTMIEPMEYEGYGTQTFIFEIVDKDDPHIVEEQEGAYLIGYRFNSWRALCNATESYLDRLATHLGCKRPKWKITKFSDVLKEVKTVKHEGFMVYGDYGTTLKLKSPFYLSKKALMRMGSNQIDKMFDKPEEFKKRLDEEFYDIFKYIISSFTKEHWASLTEQERRKIIEGYFEGGLNNA